MLYSLLSSLFQRLQSCLQSSIPNSIRETATGFPFSVSPCLAEKAYQAHKEAAHVNAWTKRDVAATR